MIEPWRCNNLPDTHRAVNYPRLDEEFIIEGPIKR